MATAKKAETLERKIYRITDSVARLKHGELRLVMERKFAKTYLHAPIWAMDDEGIRLYPEMFWYPDEIRGTQTHWQPSAREYHLLLAGETLLAPMANGRHIVLQEILGQALPQTLPMRTAHGGE